jgi:hypothetical protein
VTLIEPGAVATELPIHITHGETRQGVEQLYGQIEVTAEDIAEVIAFVVGRPRRLAIHEVLLRPAGQELRRETSLSCLGRCERPRERRGTAGNGGGNGGERRRPLLLPRAAVPRSARSARRIGTARSRRASRVLVAHAAAPLPLHAPYGYRSGYRLHHLPARLRAEHG